MAVEIHDFFFLVEFLDIYKLSCLDYIQRKIKKETHDLEILITNSSHGLKLSRRLNFRTVYCMGLTVEVSRLM